MPLLCFPKYTWTAEEAFAATAKLANYGPSEIHDAVPVWSVADATGAVVGSGKFDRRTIPQGGLVDLGDIRVSLRSVKAAKRLTVELGLEGTSITNWYSIWVYPKEVDAVVPGDILVARSFNAEVQQKLKAGGKVLYLPEVTRPVGYSLADCVGGSFQPDFWSFSMMPQKPGTLGLLVCADHPALARFPTGSHSEWQWWHLVKHSRPIVLNDAPPGYRPIVQGIDNLVRNHKLGLIFEANVAGGKLLVCSIDLLGLREKPEARQLLHSLLGYMDSDQFHPSARLDGALFDNMKLGDKPNIARQTGSSKYPAPLASFAKDEKDAAPKQILDGLADFRNPRYAWSNWTRGAARASDWVGADFGVEKTIGEVRLYVFQDKSHEIPQSVDIEYWDGADWVAAARQIVKHTAWEPCIIKIVFDPVKTSKVRANLQAVPGKALAITEFEAFEAVAP